MTDALPSAPSATTNDGPRCLNCGAALGGDFCSRCGQEASDLHRTVRQLVADVVGDVFSLDTRLLRTLRPLLLQPGELTRDYLAGRRVRQVPPLKIYLIAALVFFGLVALLPKRVAIRTDSGSASSRPGGISYDFPRRFPIFDRHLQAGAARAKASPYAFNDAVMANLPRVFFLLLPVFALFLKLLYRQDSYYLDHLVFALHYHAFAFLDFTFLLLLLRPWVPALMAWPLGMLCFVWLLAYLPVALRRVYGGSRLATLGKLGGLGLLYLAAFLGAVVIVMFATLALF